MSGTAQTNQPEQSFKVGDRVRFKRTCCASDAEHERVHIIAEWNGDRGFVRPANWSLGGVVPTELARLEQIEVA